MMRAMLVGGTQVATYDQFKTFYQKQIGAKVGTWLSNRALGWAHGRLRYL